MMNTEFLVFYFVFQYVAPCSCSGVDICLLGGWPTNSVNPYPTAFPYENGMVLHFYQQQESSTTKTVHRIINRDL